MFAMLGRAKLNYAIHHLEALFRLWIAREDAGIREGDVWHKALPYDRTTEEPS